MSCLPLSSFHARWIAIGLLLIVVSIPSHAGGQTSDEVKDALKLKLADDAKLLDGLRRRRLFEIAEFHCQDQLANVKIDPTTQASTTIQWMKTRTAKSVFAKPEERKQIWRSAAQLSFDFVKSYPDHPRKFLVEVQQALSHVSHSRLIRQEIDADMAKGNARVDALEEVESARALLNRLRREIAVAIPEQLRKSLSQHDLTSEQLMSLNNNVRFQLVVCNLNRAQLYEKSDRLNRIDALNNVVERLQEVQRTTSEGLPLWWKAKLSQIECLRLLGNPKAAQQLSVALSKTDASSAERLQLLEQKIQVAIELGDEAFSRDLFTEFDSFEERSPQVDLAALELATDQAARARTEERKHEWMAFAVKQAQTVEQSYGGYWGRRADLVLIGTTGASTNSGATMTQPKFKQANPSDADSGSSNVELDLLVRLADDSLRKKRFDDALKAYNRASKLAISVGESDQALRADLQAALILEQQQKHELAASRLTASADRDPSLSLAASTHLRGCWNFAQTVQRDKTKIGEYELLLVSHLERWGDASTTDQARVYLAKSYQSQRKWESAFQTYLQVSNNSPLLATAIAQSESSANQVLAGLRKEGQFTQSKCDQIRSLLSGVQQRLPPEDLNAMKLELAIADLDLVYGTSIPNASLAESLVAISKSDDQSTVALATAIHAVSVCIVSPDLAKQLVSQLATNETSLARCDRCLAAVEQHSQLGNELTKVRNLRLSVIDSALSIPAMTDVSNSTRQTSWMLRKSEVLAGLNRDEETLTVLTELERRFPRNAGVQMQIARAMAIQFGDSEPEKAINKWGQVANRLKPHSENWLEAKYEVARLVLQTGDAERAVKLLKYIKLNPPGWDGTKWQDKFEALLKIADLKRKAESSIRSDDTEEAKIGVEVEVEDGSRLRSAITLMDYKV